MKRKQWFFALAAGLPLLASETGCSKRASEANSQPPAPAPASATVQEVTVPADYGKVAPKGVFAWGYVAGSNETLENDAVKRVLAKSFSAKEVAEFEKQSKLLALTKPMYFASTVHAGGDKPVFRAVWSLRAANLASVDALLGSKLAEVAVSGEHGARRVKMGTSEKPTLCDVWPTKEPYIACSSGESAAASLDELAAYVAFGLAPRPSYRGGFESHVHIAPEPVRDAMRPALAIIGAGASLVEQVLPASIPEPVRSVLGRGITVYSQELLMLLLTIQELEMTVAPDPSTRGIDFSLLAGFDGVSSKFVHDLHDGAIASAGSKVVPFENLPTNVLSATWSGPSRKDSPQGDLLRYLSDLADAGMQYGKFRATTRKKTTTFMRWFADLDTEGSTVFLAPARPRGEGAAPWSKVVSTLVVKSTHPGTKCPSVAVFRDLVTDPAVTKLAGGKPDVSKKLKKLFTPAKVRGLPRTTTSQSFLKLEVPAVYSALSGVSSYLEQTGDVNSAILGCFSTSTHLYFVVAPSAEDLSFHAARLVEPNPGPSIMTSPGLAWLNQQTSYRTAGFNTINSLAHSLQSSFGPIFGEMPFMKAALAQFVSADIATMAIGQVEAKESRTTLRLRMQTTPQLLQAVEASILAGKAAQEASQAQQDEVTADTTTRAVEAKGQE